MADAYTVLARRYRSQTFDELVGQEAIAQTLKNAIKANRVAHAFLFTGTRGVGKTSAARILAKAINCPQRHEDGNPCGECNSCKAIARGEDLDVIEIDGASNNGVENIRELRQAAGIRPARSAFKIYIIDEVHMVTTSAFNALLKTLEEPPEHVKFVFATTEIGKVPATILSRCQRYDFKNIATPRIMAHLQQIVKGEGLTADEEALHRIARLGNGSMRDALSILDRVLSLGEKHISDKILEDLLGKPATAAIAELVGALAGGDAGGALTNGDKILQEGMGVEHVLTELIDFFRNMMLVVACGKQTELLDVPSEARAVYTGLAGKYDAPTLVHMIALCEQTLRSLKASTMHRPLFDALLVRLALSEQFTGLRELLAAETGAAKSTNPPVAGQKKSSPESHVMPIADVAPTAPIPVAASHRAAAPERPSAVAPPTAPATEESSAEPEENIYEVMKQHMARKKEELDAQHAQLKHGHRPHAVAPAVPASRPVEKAADLADLAGVWIAARNYLLSNARLLESVLGNTARIVALDAAAGAVTLAIPNTQQNFTNDKARAKLEEALRAVTDMPLKLQVEFVEPPAAPAGMGGGAANMPLLAAQRIPPEVMEAVQKQPVVQALMKRLDATVTQVEIIEGEVGE